VLHYDGNRVLYIGDLKKILFSKEFWFEKGIIV